MERRFLKTIIFTSLLITSCQQIPINESNKKFVGDKNTRTYTNLHDLISKHTNIILKMDIEGGEYPFLQSISRKQLNKINMIMIEFHSSRGQWGIFDEYKID